MKSQSAKMSTPAATGQQVFNFDRDATASWIEGVDLEVEGMAFAFNCEFEQQETLEIVLDALRELHHLPTERLHRWQSARRLLELNPWYAEVPVFAYVRDELDTGVIHILEHEGELVISLPHADLWDAHGLGWMPNYQRCCSRNRDNPAPWLGACCGCTPCD